MKNKSYIVIVIITLVLPIALYTYKFGFGLWHRHSDWAEMGSAIGGLYTPILSVLTLCVLVIQLKIQRQMHLLELRATSRQISFEMVEKFAIKIESMLSQEVVDDLVILSELKRGAPEAAKLKSKHLDIFTLWATIHASLKNYEKIEPNMIVDLASHAVLHLTFSICATLEQAYVDHCATDEKYFKYWFIEQ